jgi:predicted AlkP superfamily pyrophosphatase or phosphodiesterase
MVQRLLLVGVLFAAAGCQQKGGGRVLLIGIDGLRADAVTRAKTPQLDRLAAEGASTLDARIQARAPAKSGPGWLSVLTGVDADKHGVYDNESYLKRERTYATVLKRARQAGRRTAAVVHWYPLTLDLLVEEEAVDVDLLMPTDARSTDEALALLAAATPPDLLFVHLDEVDLTGHASGFSPDNPAYIAALEARDAEVGRLVAQVDARAGEKWLVVVTTDHGGAGLDHGPRDAANETIPLFLRGPGITPRTLPAGTTHKDVAPTALGHLGISVDPAWGLDGRDLR